MHHILNFKVYSFCSDQNVGRDRIECNELRYEPLKIERHLIAKLQINNGIIVEPGKFNGKSFCDGKGRCPLFM